MREKKIIKKLFAHSKDTVVKNNKIKCLALKSYVEVILKDCQMPLSTKY
jgi:hypothetical protein